MCGIAGIVAAPPGADRSNLQPMLAAMEHRGPDASGSHYFAGCALGHTRLSIIDLATGAQPMLSASGRTAVTFNGEIYGFQEIKARLADYPFRTSCDTEVLLALYDRYGERMMPHLPGMFAFAIWDDKTEALFCARDRFGEKPFYFAFGRNGEFLFASEIKALLASDLFTPVLSRAAVQEYVKYLCVGPYRTIYENVHVLPPAHTLRYRQGQISIERYWEMPATRQDIDLPEAAEELQARLSTAVSKQLVADVPVGAFLSGGLDSSTIVAEAARCSPQLKTFSFAFEGSHNEAHFAQEVAQMYGTDHTELTAEGFDLAELLIEMQRVYDEPFADSSNVPTYLLCREARRHTKVVLTGDGGDELLGGYDWYRPLAAMEGMRGDAPLRRNAARLLLKLAEVAQHSSRFSLDQWYRGLRFRKAYPTPLAAHAASMAWFGPAELRRLGLGENAEERETATCLRDRGSLNDAMRFDIHYYMAADILAKIDRASMASSLELRAPFLDVDLAEFCISLPSRLKLHGGVDKLVLRQAYGERWPATIRKRSKQGFGSPVSRWLAQEPLRSMASARLNDCTHKLFEIVSFQESRRFAREMGYKAWILLVLALWLEEHDCDLGDPGKSAFLAAALN